MSKILPEPAPSERLFHVLWARVNWYRERHGELAAELLLKRALAAVQREEASLLLEVQSIKAAKG